MTPKQWVQSLQTSFQKDTHPVYAKILNDEHASDSAVTLLPSPPSPSRSRSPYILTSVNVLLFLCSLLLILLAYTHTPTDAQCVSQLYTWSPAFEAITYHTQTYTGAFRQASAYRGKPTSELDERWLKLWDYDEFDVPEKDWRRMNRSGNEEIVRTERGGGAALLWGMHQLHCLDWLRMWSYKEVYMQRDGVMPEHFQGLSDALVRTHLDHCIDVLRQDLMCHLDVTPYFVVKDETAPMGETFDFSPQMKCRDFERIRQWNVDNLANP